MDPVQGNARDVALTLLLFDVTNLITAVDVSVKLLTNLVFRNINTSLHVVNA